MDKKEGQGVRIPAPVGHVPRNSLNYGFCAPVDSPSPGARRLEVQQVNCHSRKEAGQKADQHVPEEALHGVFSFTGRTCPTPGNLRDNVSRHKALPDLSGRAFSSFP